MFDNGAIADLYAYLFLGRIYFDDGNYDKVIELSSSAIELSTKALEDNPQDRLAFWHRVRFFWNRALSYYYLNKYDLAISDLNEVNKLDPESVNAYGLLGWIFILKGDFDEAEKHCKKANELFPIYYINSLKMGHIYLLKGDNEKAKEQYKKSLLLMKTDESFNIPIADFEFFIENGWKVEESKLHMAWMKKEWEKEKSRRWKEPNTGMEFVRIPPENFLIGGESFFEQSGKPAHRVTLSKEFYIQTTEVTQGQWKTIMGEKSFGDSKCGDNCPAVYVSWYDAQEFIKKLNILDSVNYYRLPTEAEWEYACRAGTQSQFYFGDRLTIKEANFYEVGASLDYLPSDGKVVAVASYLPNAWGVYDMHGNVWEWCQDWYGKYSAEYVIDPTGPETGDRKIVRGGAFDSWTDFCSSFSRTGPLPENRQNNIGFRLVMIPNAAKANIQKPETLPLTTTKSNVKSNFFDKFFFVIFVIVVTLSATDWLLGKEGRTKIRQKVENWWLYISDISFAGLVSQDAEMARRWLGKLFGEKVLSLRFILICAAISIITAIGLMGIICSGFYGWKFGVKFIVMYVYKLLAFNALIDYISLVITFWLISIMIKQTKFWVLSVILVTDLLLAFLLAISTYILGTIIGLVGYPYASFSFSLYWELKELTIIPIIFTAILPSLIHSIFAIIFITSKLFRPLLHKPTELILLRISESDKGVLTLVASGLGIFAKLVQEGFKILVK